MTVGEHWFCPRCGTFDGPHHEEYCTVCHEDGIDNATVKEFVPGEQLQRAIDALREIVRIGTVSRDSMRSKVRDYEARGQAMVDVASDTLQGLRDDVPDRR
jgi:hypothetical protein